MRTRKTRLDQENQNPRIRVAAIIVEGGKLAGVGAHSYTAGNATKGSEEAEEFRKSG